MKLALSVLLMSTLVGCASSQRMDIADLDYYQIDCSKYKEQHAFLRSQMTTSADKLSSMFNTSSILGQIGTRIDGTYDQHEATRGRRYDAVVRLKLDQLNRNCVPGYQTPGVCDLARPESPACQNMRR